MLASLAEFWLNMRINFLTLALMSTRAVSAWVEGDGLASCPQRVGRRQICNRSLYLLIIDRAAEDEAWGIN